MIRPAREVLRLPRERKVAVEEKTSAAAEPRWPRNHASSGTNRSSNSSQGCAKESPQGEFGDQKSGRLKRTSFYKTFRFIEQKPAVFPRRVVARKFDQVAAIQKIAEERLFVSRKGSRAGEGVEEFD